MPSHEIADALAEMLIAEDWDAAHDLMAPWLSGRWSAQALERATRGAGRRGSGAAAWRLEISPLEFEDLRVPDGFGPPSDPFPDALKRSRFRDWICIHFTPSEDADARPAGSFDVWIATAEANGDLCVGYLEFAEAA